jgi:hypothetical protein
MSGEPTGRKERPNDDNITIDDVGMVGEEVIDLTPERQERMDREAEDARAQRKY